MFTERKGSKVPTGVCVFQPPFASLSFGLSNGSKKVDSSLPFSSICAATHSTSFGTAQQEPATGIAYPSEFCVLTKKHCPQLAGAGCVGCQAGQVICQQALKGAKELT
jgi:hypothetical protein